MPVAGLSNEGPRKLPSSMVAALTPAALRCVALMGLAAGFATASTPDECLAFGFTDTLVCTQCEKMSEFVNDAGECASALPHSFRLPLAPAPSRGSRGSRGSRASAPGRRGSSACGQRADWHPLPCRPYQRVQGLLHRGEDGPGDLRPCGVGSVPVKAVTHAAPKRWAPCPPSPSSWQFCRGCVGDWRRLIVAACRVCGQGE